MKIAFVYDRVNKWGGAERVLLALHEIWPEAPLYTSVYNSETAPWAKDFKIKTSFLQNIPFAKNNHQFLSLLTPRAFASFDFSGFDIVLSITSAEAKFIKTTGKTKHICYCLTPTRYLWSQKKLYESLGFKGKVLSVTAPLSRIYDFEASQKVDYFIAISTYIKKQIKKYYQRESGIIFPPVELKDVETHCNASLQIKKPYYLIVSRLENYKRIDLAIKVCNKFKRNLIIIGSGSEENRLKKISGSTIEFIKNLTDEQLTGYYMNCQAVLFCGIEDFGIVPVEAQMLSKPVIAFGQGGVLDTILNNKTGLFFQNQTVESLFEAIIKFEKSDFDSKLCKLQAEKFSKDIFKKEIQNYIEMLARG